MEISETAIAHIALDQMISANILLSEVDHIVAVPALEPLRAAIMQLMHQFDPNLLAAAVDEVTTPVE